MIYEDRFLPEGRTVEIQRSLYSSPANIEINFADAPAKEPVQFVKVSHSHMREL